MEDLAFFIDDDALLVGSALTRLHQKLVFIVIVIGVEFVLNYLLISPHIAIIGANIDFLQQSAEALDHFFDFRGKLTLREHFLHKRHQLLYKEYVAVADIGTFTTKSIDATID